MEYFMWDFYISSVKKWRGQGLLHACIELDTYWKVVIDGKLKEIMTRVSCKWALQLSKSFHKCGNPF
jgi:hypothetical protein